MSVNNITNLVHDLEDSACSFFKKFANNKMQGNATKCHVLWSRNENIVTKVDSTEIENSQSKKLWGVTIDSQLSFEKHINNIFDKARAKLDAWSWAAPFMNLNLRKMLMITFLRHNSTISF